MSHQPALLGAQHRGRPESRRTTVGLRASRTTVGERTNSPVSPSLILRHNVEPVACGRRMPVALEAFDSHLTLARQCWAYRDYPFCERRRLYAACATGVIERCRRIGLERPGVTGRAQAELQDTEGASVSNLTVWLDRSDAELTDAAGTDHKFTDARAARRPRR